MSPTIIDFYAVLQVAPDAEREVIDAAYRQLMRKYHPDLAGDDPVMTLQLTERAKAINQAYSVLRDDGQRRIYDQMRWRSTLAPPPQPGARATYPPSPPSTAPYANQTRRPPSPAEAVTIVEPEPEPGRSAFWAAVGRPLGALQTVYFLLPGPYEWEPRGQREFMLTGFIPPLGVIAWLATSGRLAPILGRSPYALLAVWFVIGVIVLATQWSTAPRLAIAVGGMVLLMSGALDERLAASAVPLWLVWVTLGGVSMVLAARQFLFGLLPTIGLCWLIARLP